MLNLHLNLVFVLFSLYFIIWQTSAMVFEETPIEELDQLIEKQLAEERADDSEFQFSRYRRNAKMRLCGRNLLNMLKEVCNGCTSPIPQNDIDQQNETTDDSYNFKRKRDVDQHHHEHSQPTKRAGVVDHCCRNKCTIETLKMHCGKC